MDSFNWASAHIIISDFDEDRKPDIAAHQMFDGTVTLSISPGTSPTGSWQSNIIASGMKSGNDMWLADMDEDKQADIVIADHIGHRGLWFKNLWPGPQLHKEWRENLIFEVVKMPVDLAMGDLDRDGDSDRNIHDFGVAD